MRDDVRDLITGSLAPVADTADAWERIQHEVGRRQRRRSRLVASAAVGAAAAVMAVLAFFVRPPDASPPPQVGTTATPPVDPSEQAAGLPDCVSADLPESIRQYLLEWTRGSLAVSNDPDLCLLQGRPGPVAAFDTADLGQEQPLHPADTGGGLQAPTPAAGAQELDGYPAVHLGRAGQTDRHPTLAWWMNQRRTGIILCLQNSCSHESDVPPDELTIASVGGNSRSMFVTAWVPADTAAVSVTIDGQAQVWQRPVARTVQIEFDPTPGEVDFSNPGEPADGVQVTAYDAEGNVLAEATHPIL